MASSHRTSILNLPLVPRGSRLTQLLLPDPITPTPSSLVSVKESAPSLLRRSRGVGEGAHFSYATPLLLPFPYDLPKDNGDEAEGESTQNEAKNMESLTPEQRQEYSMEKARKEMEKIERLMRPFEVQPDSVEASDSTAGEEKLKGYLPPGRQSNVYPSARILALSESCRKDCLPELDVGDTVEWIRSHSGKDGPDSYTSGPMAPPPQNDAARARYQLSDLLGGRMIGAILPSGLDSEHIEPGAERGVAEAQHRHVLRRRNGESNEEEDQESTTERWTRRSNLLEKRQKESPHEFSGYAPWSNAYSGHQFGEWAGQLGDGRAITLLETLNSKGQRWEIQLKGAGRTPFSRFADGLATLASSVREFLASEAMHGLNIPTSRSLCVISLKDLAVLRETRNAAAIATRLAPIWTRVGSFEHHAVRQEWESVRLLGEFVCSQGYGWQDVHHDKESPAWAERLVFECAQRNARTVAQWQVYGFMHGVMNTDNISLLGITIDYGPFAFMDLFDRYAICNKSDGEGRYAYHMQPTAALFVLEKLTDALGFLIGFEKREGRAAKPGELVALSQDEINELGKAGRQETWTRVKDMFMDTLLNEWIQGWRKRLALTTSQDGDRAELIDPLLDIFEGYVDFTLSMRNLARFEDYIDLSSQDPSAGIETFRDVWLDWDAVPSYVREQKRADALRWLQAYISRLRKESHSSSHQIASGLRTSNPSFILRNWVTDDVVKRLEQHDDTSYLELVLDMCLKPFEPWGEETPGKDAERLSEEKVSSNMKW